MFNFYRTKAQSFQNWFEDPSNDQIFSPPEQDQHFSILTPGFLLSNYISSTLNYNDSLQFNAPLSKNDKFEHQPQTQDLLYSLQLQKRESQGISTQEQLSDSSRFERLSLVSRINSQNESMIQQSYQNSVENVSEFSVPKNKKHSNEFRTQAQDRNVLPLIKKIFKESLLDTEVNLKAQPFLKTIFYESAENELVDKRKTSQIQLQALIRYKPISQVWEDIKMDRNYEMILLSSKAELKVKIRAIKKIQYFFSLLKSDKNSPAHKY